MDGAGQEPLGRLEVVETQKLCLEKTIQYVQSQESTVAMSFEEEFLALSGGL